MPDAAIGIFDSGVGGLTVAKSIMKRLPHEPILYLGDTARVPYGTKSPLTVVRYATAAAALLMERDIKLLVVACNTASAMALESLQADLDVPVVGVIEPGARSAISATKNGRIGIIGTRGTIGSQAYQKAIHALDPAVEVFGVSCPLFVPLAEEGWTEGEVARNIAETYLAELCEKNIDTLVLGCTHYPLLKKVITEIMGDSVTLVDSAESTAEVAEEILEAMGLSAQSRSEREHAFLVSDSPESFVETGKAFLGDTIHEAEWVDF